ncbi:MAG: hypothetical protein PHF46_04600 [Candidatus Gracilibacteria bacterium]|nr:hypothetical protein [Candidatus Gracilibacteria bacterium]MDD3120661.1 hypothetical protein [Candidatus Gracilibacteria bacterium]
MKKIKALLLILICSLMLGINLSFATDLNTNKYNIKTDTNGGTDRTSSSYLGDFSNGSGGFFDTTDLGNKGVETVGHKLIYDAKNVIIAISIVFLFLILIRVAFSKGNEEDQKKWRLGILWTILGIVLIQASSTVMSQFFDKDFSNPNEVINIYDKIFKPTALLLENLAAFIFLAMAIMSYYRMVSAGGEDEKMKKGKNAIMFSCLGIFLIKAAGFLVSKTTGLIDATNYAINAPNGTDIVADPKITELPTIIASGIKYINGFIGVVVVIMIIYAGFLIMSGSGDESKIKKGKNIIMYSVIGIFVLMTSYLILNLFIGIAR